VYDFNSFSMNRRRPRKLKRLNLRPKELKTEPKPGNPDERAGVPGGNANRLALAKALIKRAFPIASLALAVTIAVAVGLFFLIKSVNSRTNPSKNSQVAAVSKPPTPVAKVNSPPPVVPQHSPALAKLDPIQSDTIIAASPTPSPIRTQTPVQRAIANTSSSPASTPKNSDHKPRELSETQRKFVELKRREAERKRSRLEALYRKHEISDEAYKKGQDEYQNAMAKYRNAVNGSESANE
jgi:type IV secretory pathway VirB10-like protein